MNLNHPCDYFDDMIKFEDFDFHDILIDEKSYENILIYGILQRTLIRTKPLRIRYNKIDRFIRIYNGTRSLVLFGPQKCDVKKVNYVCFFSLLHENQS